MNHKIQRLVSKAVAVSTTLTMTGVSLIAQSALAAGQLTQASATLSDVRSTQSSSYTVAFHVATAGAIRQVNFIFANTASGSTVPNVMDTTSATLNNVTVGASNDTSNWSVTTSTNGTINVVRSSATSSLSSNTLVSIKLDGIANNSTTSGTQCDAISNSDSCWIQITDYSDTGTTLVDKTTVTYTVITAVTVDATVDPILKFTLSGVANTAITSNDPKAASGDAATTTTSTATAISFGNITVGASKIAQQKMVVQTNANNGYTVYQKFLGTNPLVGSASASNHFRPFSGSSATWSSPQVWTGDPTGTTANTDTGWIGVRTTDTDVANFNSNDVYGPPVVSDTATGNAVMTSTTPDIGSDPANAIYVSYKVRVNANQPADKYAGTIIYNVVPSY